MGKTIPLLSLEAKIKRSLRRHLRELGFSRDRDGMLRPPGDSKDCLRSLHRMQRAEKIRNEGSFLNRVWPKLSKYFADGHEISPMFMSPRLELVNGGTWQSDLFRLASLIWSIPVSQGYGRRMRFIIWDDFNNKLIGIVGLGDPVFNLRVRDELISWNVEDRKKRLASIMDAYVLGAIPPYSFLLCGKLVATLIKTREIRDEFKNKYSTSKGIISGENKNASLLMVTTSSALGRSSIYNRLKLDGEYYFEPIGYTSGWGHFHIPQELFNLMREYLYEKGHKYADNNRFGQGPNWKIRVIRETFIQLGITKDLLRHGIKREVFICKLASNAIKVLSGKAKDLEYQNLKAAKDVAALAKNRWVIPRAERFREYEMWKKENILRIIHTGIFPKRLVRPISSQEELNFS